MFPNLLSLRFQPLRCCPEGVGKWTAHLPFAADLVDALKPSLLVELGTESGDSYFGLCQVIPECGIRCSAYAVGTWNGHSHDGDPQRAPFEEVSAYNTAHYRSFSNLLRMTSDEASARFADESIDLLHLRGYYDDIVVRHDFETWLPKVSTGGIILVHDIGLRNSDCGVGRYWEEIAARFSSFAFHHTCGLGIIAKPGGTKEASPLLRALFSAKSEFQTIRDYYALCADRLFHRLESRSEITQLRQALDEAQAELVRLRTACDDLVELRQQPEAGLTQVPGQDRVQVEHRREVAGEQARLRDDKNEVGAQLHWRDEPDSTQIIKGLEFFSQHLGQAETEVRALSNDRTRLESSIEQLWAEARRSRAELESLRMNLEAAHAERTAIQQSLSWKITSPLRVLGLLLAYRGHQH